MSAIVPFKALRPKPDFIGEVAALPYDVVSTAEAQEIVRSHPRSFLRVEKSELDLPADVPAHDPRIYDRAKDNLETLIREGVLFQDKAPSFYIYAQGMKGYRQYGLVAGASVAEYEAGQIRKHELTRADKELDRIRHVDRVNAHTGPVFLTYQARPGIDALVAETAKATPEYDFITEDGISHTVWVLNDPVKMAAMIEEFSKLDCLYIADGHHRAAAAAAVADLRRKENPARGNDESQNMLAVLFPHEQLRIMDYNRTVKDLNGLGKEAFLQACEAGFVVTGDYHDKSPRNIHEFGLYLDGRWYGLAARPSAYDATDPIGCLDVSILQEQLLGPVLGIDDPRRDERIAFVGGIRGMEELERMVDSGQFALAFALYPVTIEQLMAVADAHRIMPPKSTWFEPKLRSGIFVHLLEQESGNRPTGPGLAPS